MMKVCGHGPCGSCCTCGAIVRKSEDVLPDGYPLGMGDTGFPEHVSVYANVNAESEYWALDAALPPPVD